MNKFDSIVNNYIAEDESLDQWNQQKMREEQTSSQTHDFDTLSHPVKDEMVMAFKNWIKEGEHQDGEAFWDNFEDVQEAVGDFLRTVGGIAG
jgi:hypothetical protein